jgi:LacI family transcriptional regulator
MGKKVSQKDIAKEVGVSTALVSYVLNNLKEGRISKEIASRIREVAQKLNYRPNQIAKSLKTSKTYTIGLIVADISNPFSSTLARIVEDEVNKFNYTVIFGSSDENAQKAERVVDTLLNRQVDGLIISPPAQSEKLIRDLQKQDIPFVLLDRYFPDIKTNYVVLNNYEAAFMATKHLLEADCKRIGIVSYNTELFHLQERKRGYSSALKEAKLSSKKSWIKEVDISNDKKEIEKAVKELLNLPEPVDALLFASNIIAAYGLRYINTLPLRVPDDLSIVSFDETEALDLFYAPLTYIKQPLQEMGQMATKILLECIGSNNKVTQVDMDAQLIVRASSVKLSRQTSSISHSHT